MAKRDGSATRAPSDIHEQIRKSAEEFAHLDPLNLELTLLFYRIILEMNRAHTEELLPRDLNIPEFNVLTVLDRADEPMRMSDLGASLSVRPNSLTATMNSLERKQLVRRAENPDDKRSFLLEITRKGQQFLDRFLPGHWNFLESLYQPLGTDQREQLADTLELLHRHLVELQGS